MYYELEYSVRSSRGDFRYVARVAVGGNRLFVLTAKVKDASWEEGGAVVRSIVDSFRINV